MQTSSRSLVFALLRSCSSLQGSCSEATPSCSQRWESVVSSPTLVASQVRITSFTTKQETNPGQTVSGNTYDSLSARVAEVQGIIANDSVDTYDLNSATTATLDAFIKTMNDPYARYFDASSYQTYLNSVSSPSTGIGVLFGESDG